MADCQSFYASVEKAMNPWIENEPVVVAGDPERRSGIVLAACPIAKKYGVTTAETLREALAKCPQLVVIKPRMQLYIDVSLQITKIYERFTDLVEPYSIDEQFLDLTGSRRLFGKPERMARTIQEKVRVETGVKVRIGYGENKILAKLACDNFAKKNAAGFYHLRKENLADDLWKLPVSKMFMVGSRMTAHFGRMGIYTIGELAQTPLPDLKRKLRAKLGRQSDIQAEMFWQIANGIDHSPVDPYTLTAAEKSIGHQMTLPRDYGTQEEIDVILLELSELVARRCRDKGMMGWVVSAGAQGANFDAPTGFYRQMKLPDPTNLTDEIYAAARDLFRRHWDRLPVRKIGVSLSQLVSDDIAQLVLFSDRERKRQIAKVTDDIKTRFGDASIMRAASITEAGQARDRAHKIGGHYK